MLINDLACETNAGVRVLSAMVVWEDRDFPSQQLIFEISDPPSDGELVGPGAEAAALLSADGPSPDAFLAACFPLAAVHGETRVRIEGQPCPMLMEGLRTVHAWWTSWGGMPFASPEIEVSPGARRIVAAGPRRATAFLSGGVDGLHMLMRNRQLYQPDDPAYIRDALFIHGFDIGKRARDPENERYRMVLRRLEPVAAETAIRIIPCRTNLRHLPSQPDFWEHRHSGPALIAVGHAALHGPAFLLLGGSYPVSQPVPCGSHPAVDGLLSSQRVTVVHEGSRFSRLEKVRELATWPTAIGALRVCSANAGIEANCGRCEKCLRTRLELLAAGIYETAAFGSSLTPVDLWEAAVPAPSGHLALRYEELLPILRARGLHAICRILEEKIAMYRQRVQAAGDSMPLIPAMYDYSLEGRPDWAHYPQIDCPTS
jgi:hypothetical protein